MSCLGIRDGFRNWLPTRRAPSGEILGSLRAVMQFAPCGDVVSGRVSGVHHPLSCERPPSSLAVIQPAIYWYVVTGADVRSGRDFGEMGAQDGMKRTQTTTVVKLKQARRPTVADIIDRVLDKGIVIEHQVDRVSLSGIDVPITVHTHVVVASLDTYLQYAEPLSKAGFVGGSDTWLDKLSGP